MVDERLSGTLTEKSIAESLNISLRTLRRRLCDEKPTYREILEKTRRQLPQRFVGDDELTLAEMTYLLGLSEVSSFSRSFKRWKGMSPKVYRRKLNGGGIGST